MSAVNSTSASRVYGTVCQADSELAQRTVREHITSPEFPCVMGAGAIKGGAFRVGVYADMASYATAEAVSADVARFAAERRSSPDLGSRFNTLITVYKSPSLLTERRFESTMWRHLAMIAECDALMFEWDPAVSRNVRDETFAMSVGGTAFFLVGMHPGASRLSRRLPYAAIAWNAHEQFEQLRRKGSFDRVRDVIRRRDESLQGNINPNLTDFGEASDALQYSGRRTDAECPFHAIDKAFDEVHSERTGSHGQTSASDPSDDYAAS